MKRLFFLRGVLAATLVLAMAVVTPTWAQAPFDPPGLDRAIAAKNFHVNALLEADGVVGVGVGLTMGGQAAVVITTESAGIGDLPRSLDGVPVVIMVTGAFNAINKPGPDGHNHGTDGDPPPDSSAGPCDSDPTAICDTPVPIGVSTGNASSCSAGTIGFRVKRVTGTVTEVFSLSNNHVYALENDALVGAPIVQPGLFDTNCDGVDSTVIGTLAGYNDLDFHSCSNGGVNDIDAAIATATTDVLWNATPSSGYGTPNSTPVETNLLNLAVQKYGRTTGLTRGTVTVIDWTGNIGYSNGLACFKDQIIVQSRKGAFIKSGDSGSGLVTDDDAANPVGLLFAGNRSGKVAIANRIGKVLSGLNVMIDGE